MRDKKVESEKWDDELYLGWIEGRGAQVGAERRRGPTQGAKHRRAGPKPS